MPRRPAGVSSHERAGGMQQGISFDRIGLDELVAALRAAGEPTRLRVLSLLAQGELSVKDLTTILGQSQPRISRHLKLLVEAGLVERSAEGAFAYYRLADTVAGAAKAAPLLALLDRADPLVQRDRERLEEVRRAHAEQAAHYFAMNAGEWDRIRTLHVPEAAVEAAMREMVGERRFREMLDLGTGTGRMLALFAGLYDRAVGVDASAPMLSVARSNLQREGNRNARLLHGDIYGVNLPKGRFDLVTIHQVLHHLAEPGRAIAEAARVLRPGGRLLVVDFAPHELEELRTRYAHRRLGFSREEVLGWLEAAGLHSVETRDLVPEGGADGELTVTLWLARDPRIEIADTETSEMTGELA